MARTRDRRLIGIVISSRRGVHGFRSVVGEGALVEEDMAGNKNFAGRSVIAAVPLVIRRVAKEYACCRARS